MRPGRTGFFFFIPTKVCPNPVKPDHFHKHQAHLLHQQHQEYVQLRHSALAGAVWDDNLKKMTSHKELVNHRNNIICKRWTQGGENEFGRLFQGFSPNGIDGLDVLEWITKKQVHGNKRATYPRYTASYRPKKLTNPSVYVYVQVETYYSMMETLPRTQLQWKLSKPIGTQLSPHQMKNTVQEIFQICI